MHACDSATAIMMNMHACMHAADVDSQASGQGGGVPPRIVDEEDGVGCGHTMGSSMHVVR